MSAQLQFDFSISAPESLRFAQLSGDFNPLHIDPIRARRLQFGGTVCHGVHLILKSLDRIADAGLVRPSQLQSIAAVFAASVRNDLVVDLAVTGNVASGPVRLAASAAGRPLFSAKLVEAGDQASAPEPLEADVNVATEPEDPAFPATQSLAGTSSTVQVRLNRPLFENMFPALARMSGGAQWAAELMATTCIVGMRLPGLHSIYSELKLQRAPAEAVALHGSMAFEATKVDPRFRSVRIGVHGAVLQGTLDAFFRAPPVEQPRLDTILKHVPAGFCSGQRALVVGGSRGLGELVAKILWAGGAQVTVSYARGIDDAQRICREAERLGMSGDYVHIDASQPLQHQAAVGLANAGFTHVYYFATPQIVKSPAGTWNPDLFNTYCALYVHGFAEIVKAVASAAGRSGPLHVLCPSTVFLDHPEPGFAEYCTAKAAAESLCEQLTLGTDIRVAKPRLARMKTDQTSSFLGSDAADPLPLMLDVVLAFCRPAPP